MKVSELIKELQEQDQDAEVEVQVYGGCNGPEDWFKNPWIDLSWDEKAVVINAERGCLCVSRKDRLPLPEIVKENVEMRKAFFEIRKLAFLDKMDRNHMLELAVKFVGNQPQGASDEEK